MTGSLFSASWYRVAALRPRLRSHAQIHRHLYRGHIWYVLQDLTSERYHRFSQPVYFLIGLMDGRRTVQEVWEVASEHLGDEIPTQDEIIQLLAQLHGADVLQCDVPPDTVEILERYDRQQRRGWQSRLLNPLFWRLPLFDPDRFLSRFLPFVQPFFTKAGALLWFAVVGFAVVLVTVYWRDLTENVIDRVLAPQNLALLWLLFPVLKIAHEFGHAFATKVYGGEVHEMGVMLLVFTPLPYVEASSASAFHNKWHRIIVGAAGMIVELFIASLALFVWLIVEPGTVRVVAYNIMLIAGVSTVLFNVNPLLRYDGYYIFSDSLEIPNLRSRSNRYITHLCERYLFGQREAEPPIATLSERIWFILYAIASFVYRIFVFVAILLFIANRFFFIGAFLAIWAIVPWGIVPAAKGLSYLFTSPRLNRVRIRAVTVSGIIVAALVGVICLVPVPLRSRAEGIVWIPEQAIVRAKVDGFIDRMGAQPGASVRQGDILLVCQDPFLSTRVNVLEFRLQEMKASYDEQWFKDLVKAELIKEEMAQLKEDLAHTRKRMADLIIRSHTAGTFVLPKARDLPGRFVKQGTPLGHVIDLTTLNVRVVVAQAEIDLIRQRTQAIEVRLAERLAETIPAIIKREVPSAREQLPSIALGSQGGGQIAVDPSDTGGMKALQKMFQFELEMSSSLGVVNVGGRVYVRFDHGWEPLVKRWYRQVRQLFLSRFNV